MTTLLSSIRETGNLATLVDLLADQRRSSVAVVTAGEPSTALTFGELARRAGAAAACLAERGVEPGGRVAILAEAEPRWAVALFATLGVGAVAVPLDPSATVDELRSVLAHCGARILLLSRREQGRGAAIGAAVPGLATVLLDDLPVHATGREPLQAATRLSVDAPAVIAYTSGTTAQPKGVLLSHGNLLAQLAAFEQVLPRGGERVVSFLPLNHLFELTVGLLGVLSRGGCVCYCRETSPAGILAAMRCGGPTLMVTVPLFLVALKSRIEREIHARGPLAGGLCRALLRLAAHVRSARARRALLYPLHRGFGGHLRTFIAGGAALDPAVAAFFERLGVAVLQGYGMTEAGPVISTNTPSANRAGSVGRPLPGVEVRIAANGEIRVRGPNVMLGYFADPAGSRAALDSEGWLSTGDTGRLDADGFLHVTGRLKDLIVLPNGKKVHPDEVEAALFGSPAVKQGCIVGRPARGAGVRGSDEVCAVVVPSDTLRAAHARDANAMLRALRAELNRLGATLPLHQRPTSIVVRWDELPMTSLRKVRRTQVCEWLALRESAPC